MLCGIKSGRGTMTYANGDVYTGNFLNEDKSGSGTMRYSDGSSWAGIWLFGEKTEHQQVVKRGQ